MDYNYGHTNVVCFCSDLPTGDYRINIWLCKLHLKLVRFYYYQHPKRIQKHSFVVQRDLKLDSNHAQSIIKTMFVFKDHIITLM